MQEELLKFKTIHAVSIKSSNRLTDLEAACIKEVLSGPIFPHSMVNKTCIYLFSRLNRGWVEKFPHLGEGEFPLFGGN